MKRICAWCNKYLGTVEAPGVDPDDITHGMCDRCAERLLSDTPPSPPDFFAGVTLPALVIQDDLHICCANQQACDLLNKSQTEIIGMYSGNAIDCIHAKKTGGCRKTEFCDHCNLTNSILKTLETGESRKAVAYPHVQRGSRRMTLRLSISTQKLNRCILLCIDEMHEVTLTD